MKYVITLIMSFVMMSGMFAQNQKDSIIIKMPNVRVTKDSTGGYNVKIGNVDKKKKDTKAEEVKDAPNDSKEVEEKDTDRRKEREWYGDDDNDRDRDDYDSDDDDDDDDDDDEIDDVDWKDMASDVIFKRKKKKRLKKVRTKWFLMDLGFNLLLDENNSLTNDAPFEQDIWKSKNFNLHVLQQRISLINHHLNFIWGVGLEYNNYGFGGDQYLLKDKENVEWASWTDGTLKKNRLHSTYVQVPLMLNIESNPFNRSRSFHISAGPTLGLLLKSNHQLETDDVELKYTDRFHQEKFKLGVRTEIGYGKLNFYANYALQNLFEEKRDGGYKRTPLNVGIVLFGF